jgi:phage repressor protein C with HTH and peptisase S24 domain
VVEIVEKRVVSRAAGGWLLRADNVAYGEEEVPKNELDEIHVLGRVGGAFRKM